MFPGLRGDQAFGCSRGLAELSRVSDDEHADALSDFVGGLRGPWAPPSAPGLLGPWASWATATELIRVFSHPLGRTPHRLNSSGFHPAFRMNKWMKSVLMKSVRMNKWMKSVRMKSVLMKSILMKQWMKSVRMKSVRMEKWMKSVG